MKKLILTGILLLFSSTAFSAPQGSVQGMIGKSIPQFIVYTPFTQQVITCKSPERFQVKSMVRTYGITLENEKTVEVRRDIFIGNTIIGYWMHGHNTFYAVDSDSVVVAAIPLEEFKVEHVCSAVAGYYNSIATK